MPRPRTPRPARLPRTASPCLALVLVLPLLVSCDGPTGPDDGGLREEIEAHRQGWEARPFRDYAYRLQRDCFCPPEARGPVRVVVRRGQVMNVLDPETGEPVSERLHHLFPGIGGLFVVLLDAVDRGADDVEVEWDPDLGFPARVFIDYHRQTADEELGFEAADVEPLD